MNVLPSPTALVAWISPPRRRAISRLIDRPRPVPAVAAAGRAVGLLERLEDQPELVRVDPDARCRMTANAIDLGAGEVVVREHDVGPGRGRRAARRGPCR